jgi:hypothetical protein
MQLLRRRSRPSGTCAAVLTLTTLLFAACATGRSRAGGPQSNENVITLAEIQTTEARNALEVVQELRPRWMKRNRGARSFADGPADFTRVVVDELQPDDFNVLEGIPRELIAQIRYLDAREATFRYGTGYTAGIIVVTTKR